MAATVAPTITSRALDGTSVGDAECVLSAADAAAVGAHAGDAIVASCGVDAPSRVQLLTVSSTAALSSRFPAPGSTTLRISLPDAGIVGASSVPARVIKGAPKPAVSVLLDASTFPALSGVRTTVAMDLMRALLGDAVLCAGAQVDVRLPSMAGTLTVARTVPASTPPVVAGAGLQAALVRVVATTRITFAAPAGEPAPPTPLAAVAALATADGMASVGGGSTVSVVPVDAVPMAVGVGAARKLLAEMLLLPFQQAPAVSALRLDIPSGVLLHGPPGVGKTLLVRDVCAHAAAEVTGLAAELFVVNGPQLLTAQVGESERRLRELFAAATAHAWPAASSGAASSSTSALSVIFFDELDALCPRRVGAGGPLSSSATGGASASSGSSARLVAQLLTLMDGATTGSARGKPESNGGRHLGRVVVVGATNRPDSLDPALRRPGRFEREVRLDPPTAAARHSILLRHLRGTVLADGVAGWLPELAERCVGYVGADIEALCREAAAAATMRASDSAIGFVAAAAGTAAGAAALAKCVPAVTQADFEHALTRISPSALREYAQDVAKTSWADIGGMDDVIARLRSAVELPLKHHAAFKSMGLAPPRGILLHGPPGNSKTTLVRALASALRASFFSLSGADIYSPYIGEAEKTLRTVFARARAAVPALLFLDEIDSIVGSRGIGGSGGGSDSSVSTGILATLLTEMDGVVSADGLMVVAATNRKEALDPALLRPGRLELHLHVPLPDEAGRLVILQVHSRHAKLDSDVRLETLAARTVGWSGADLGNLCREAAMEALREDITKADTVSMRHLESALARLAAMR